MNATKKRTAPNDLYIEDKVQNKTRGVLKKAECKQIVEFLYNDSDSKQIFSRICENLNPREKIRFCEFEQLVLNFQQEAREKTLSLLTEKFRVVDTNSDGVITAAQFNELLGLLEIKATFAEVSKIQGLTLSDTVNLISKNILSKSHSV
jgi:Ca2+-binding EF-hand superfamily protein